MLLTDQFLGSIFSKAPTYEKYLTTGNEEQQQRWHHVHDAVSLNAKQTLQDWLDEVERIQLMLRLSTRLRQKYGD